MPQNVAPMPGSKLATAQVTWTLVLSQLPHVLRGQFVQTLPNGQDVGEQSEVPPVQVAGAQPWHTESRSSDVVALGCD